MPSSESTFKPDAADPRLAVISNPHLKALRRDKALAQKLRECVSGAGAVGRFEMPDSLEALRGTLTELRNTQVRVVAIHGGDGTVHQTLSVMHDVYGDAPWPHIAYLRGGTLNTVSRGLGLRHTPLQRMTQLVAALREGRSIPVRHQPTLKVEGRVGFIFGTGVVARFLKAYYQHPAPSPLTAAALMLRAIPSRQLQVELGLSTHERLHLQWAEGASLSRTFLTVAAATVPQIGLGFKPFHRNLEPPYGLALLGFYGTLKALIKQLPRVYRGRPMPARLCIDVSVKSFTLRAQQALDYTIDGDLYTSSGELEVSLGPTLPLLMF